MEPSRRSIEAKSLNLAHDATNNLITEVTLGKLLHQMIETGRKLTKAQYGAIVVLDERGDLKQFTTVGIKTEERELIGELPKGSGILGVVLKEGKSLRVNDITNDPGASGFPPNHPPINSFLGVPITLIGKVVGSIFLTNKEGGAPFTEQDEDLVSTLASAIGVAIDNAKLHEEIKKQADYFSSSNKNLLIIKSITEAVHQSLNLKEVYSSSLDKVMELEYVDFSCVYLVDENKNEAVLQDHRNLPDEFLKRASTIAYPKGVTWKVIETGKILNVKNASEDPDIGPAGKQLGFRSMLGIPIRLGDKTIGAIWLLSYNERLFTDTEVGLLTSIGTQIATAISRANQYKELSKKNRYEKIISSVTRSVHKSLDLQEVLENAVHSMSENIDGANVFGFYLVEGEEAVLKAHRGQTAQYIEQASRIAYPKGITWKTIIEGQTIYIPDVDEDEVLGAAGRQMGIKSHLSVPINLEGKTVGTIGVGSVQKKSFGADEIRLLEIVANQTEIAINNVKQQGLLRQSEERYRTLFDQSPIGVYIFDREFEITHCNERFAQILQTSLDKIIGINMQELGDPCVLPLMEKVFQGHTESYEGFYEANTSSAKLWVSIRLSPLRDDIGNVLSGMAVVEDITERKQANNELEARERQREALVELGQLALRGGDLTALMSEAVSLVAKTLGVEYAKILELHPDSNSLLLKAGVGWRDGYVGHCIVDAGAESQAGYTLLLNETVIVNDMAKETRFTAPPLLRDHGVASGLSTTIYGKETPYGVLGAHSVSVRTYTKDDVHFLQGIGNLISDAVERYRVEDELRIINSIMESVNKSSKLDDVFETAIDKVLELTDINIVGIYLIDEATNEAVLEAHRGYSDAYIERAERIPYPKGVTWKVIGTGENYVVQDVLADPYVGEAGKEAGFQSFMSVPIKVGERAIGTIHFHSFKRNYFGRREIDLLSSIGSQIAIAVSKAKQTEDLELINEDLRILNVITTSVHKSLKLKEVLDIALDKIVEITEFDIIMVYLVEEDTNEAVLQAHRGLTEDYIERAGRIPYPKGVTWKVINSGEVYYAEDVQKDPAIGPAGRALAHHTMLVLPIKQEEKTSGIVVFASRRVLELTSRDINLLNAVGNQIGIAIVQASLYERSQKQSEQLRGLYSNLDERRKDLEIVNTITQAVHKSLDLEEIYEIALDLVVNLENVDVAMIYLVDEGRKEAILRAQRNLPQDYINRAGRIPYPKGATWHVINQGDVVNIEDIQKDPTVGPAGRDIGHHSALGVPINIDEKVIGVFWILSYGEHKFEKQEIELLSSIGGQIATAIAKANLFRELTKKKRYEEIIGTVTRSVHQSIDLENVLENAVKVMSENIDGADNVSIYMVEGQEAVMKASCGYPEWFIERVGRIPYPRGFTWKTIKEEKPLYVADASKDAVIGSAGLEVGTKSYASMPIRREGKTIGCININSLQLNAFEEEELKLLDSVSKQIETAVNNARYAEALSQSEERYRILFDQSPVGVFIFDDQLKIIESNTTMANILRSSSDKITGFNMNELRNKSFFPVMKKALEGETCHHESFYEATTSSAKLWLSLRASPLQDSFGKVTSGMAVVEDITERIEMQQALLDSEERLAAIFNNTPNIAVEGYDIDGRVLYWNKAAEKTFGWTSEQAIGKPLDQLILDAKSTKEFTSILKEISTTNNSYGPLEWEFRSREGQVGTVYSTIFPIRSLVGKKEFIRMDVDITDRKRQEKKIRHMAMHDSLTDLPNRRALYETLDRLISRPRFKGTHALVIMDLDNFKLVNDTLGHLDGDQLLKDLGDILRGNIRSKDLLARIGGDEFAMVLRDVTPDKARAIAKRFQIAISDYSFNIKGFSFHLGMSIGITMFDSKTDPQMIMAMAYSALSTAKYQGKNRITVSRKKGGKDIDLYKASQLVVSIKEALQQNRFILHFQPVIQLENGEIEYIESFVRMIDKRKRILFPKAFILAAEHLGLMPEIDRWVVEEVVRILSENRKHRLFVNLSGSSLRDTSLLGFIERCVKANTGVSERLGFEITEFSKITDLKHVRNWMISMKNVGCKFSLDDFGIGYSSFSYLISLPLDYVKIEGSFIRNINIDPTSTAIAQSIIQVSHALGKQVIAESVETKSVLEFLKRNKVEFGQGNLWKKADKHINY